MGGMLTNAMDERQWLANKRRKLSKSSLLWFIRSRPYAMVAEVRRRFELDEGDEVSLMRDVAGRNKVWIGLPFRAARMMEELSREGRIGIELNVNVLAPVAVGLYAHDLVRSDRTHDIFHPTPTGGQEAPDAMDEPNPES